MQLRAARALVGLSQQELAERSSVGIATIKRIEASGHGLTGTARVLARLLKTLEVEGVVFISNDGALGPGVRLKHPLE